MNTTYSRQQILFVFYYKEYIFFSVWTTRINLALIQDIFIEH